MICKKDVPSEINFSLRVLIFYNNTIFQTGIESTNPNTTTMITEATTTVVTPTGLTTKESEQFPKCEHQCSKNSNDCDIEGIYIFCSFWSCYKKKRDKGKNCKDEHIKSYFCVLAWNPYAENLLENEPQKARALVRAIRNNDLSRFKTLYNETNMQNPFIRKFGNTQVTAKYYAAYYGKLDFFKFITDKVKDMQREVPQGIWKGATPLHLAAHQGHLSIVEYITNCLKGIHNRFPLITSYPFDINLFIQGV